MQLSTSLSLITSRNSSIYGSQTIMNAEDLPSMAPRCRSSIISTSDSYQNQHSSIPFSSIQSTTKCGHLFRSCFSFRKRYFSKLCRYHRLLLVLDDYQCNCGCKFSIKQDTFVLLYETHMKSLSSYNKTDLITVISNQLVYSKIPSSIVCDIDILRERVRSRYSCSKEQSFDL